MVKVVYAMWILPANCNPYNYSDPLVFLILNIPYVLSSCMPQGGNTSRLENSMGETLPIGEHYLGMANVRILQPVLLLLCYS